MAYRIAGLRPELFSSLIGADAATLAAHRAVRVTAGGKPGYPCRITLEDAEAGESLILLHHVSHDAATPFRASHAIYVREGAAAAAEYRDTLPPFFAGRPLSLRGFDACGMLHAARLAMPGEAEGAIRALLDDPAVEQVHAHHAAYGCFLARITRG